MKVFVEFASAPFWSREGTAKGSVIASPADDTHLLMPGTAPRVWFKRDRDSIRAMKEALKAGETVIVEIAPEEVVRTEGA